MILYGIRHVRTICTKCYWGISKEGFNHQFCPSCKADFITNNDEDIYNGPNHHTEYGRCGMEIIWNKPWS